MSNRTIYLRVSVIEEIPTRKREETVEETIDGFEIEFADVRDARKVLRQLSDAAEDHEQFDIMDEGDDDDADDDEDDDQEDNRELLSQVGAVVKKHLRKKLR